MVTTTTIRISCIRYRSSYEQIHYNSIPIANIIERLFLSTSLHLKHICHLHSILAVSLRMCLLYILLYQAKKLILVLDWCQLTLESLVMAVYRMYLLFVLLAIVQNLHGYLDITESLRKLREGGREGGVKEGRGRLLFLLWFKLTARMYTGREMSAIMSAVYKQHQG